MYLNKFELSEYLLPVYNLKSAFSLALSAYPDFP